MTIQEAIKTIIQQNNKFTELLTENDNGNIEEEINNKLKPLIETIDNHEDILNIFMPIHDYTYMINNTLTDIRYAIGLENKNNDCLNINNVVAQLKKLGTNYISLYKIAKTLKTFIESTDTADTTINTWREIENFLAGIEDSDSLLSIINNLSQEITNLQNNVTAELSQINTTLDAPITRDKIDKDNTGLFKSYNVSEIDDIKETGSYIIKLEISNEKPSILLVFKRPDNSIGQTLISIHNQNTFNGTYFDIKTREYDINDNSWSYWQYSTLDSNLIRDNTITQTKLANNIITIRYNIIINISDTAITSIKVNNTTKTVAELKTIISNISLNTDAIKITVKIGNINIPVKTFDLSGYIIAESIDFNTLNRSIYLVDIVNNTVTKKEINYLS